MDDERHAIDILIAHIAKVPQLEIKLATTNPVEACTYIQLNHIDLIFLDIQMPGLTGLQFLSLLNEKTKVILTTAYREYALDGYEHNVVDYLLKPVLFPRFLKAVSRIIENESGTVHTFKSEKEFIFVKTGIRNKLVKVDFEKILYVESMGNYINFVLEDSKVTTLMTLKEVEKELPKNQFIRIHQSYVVAKKNILGREGNQILIQNRNLPIGETYKKNVHDFFM
ncbi:MAG: response regulator transcription factor [Chitinophagales bacterium]|nr:response regulator transcription factor [Chitinophagales bacterium]